CRRQCRGTDCGSLTQPFSGTITGGLTVSDGDTCILVGATINGGIDMSGGHFIAFGSTINRPINANGGICVTLGAANDPRSENLAHYGLESCAGDTLNGHLVVKNVNGGPEADCGGDANVEVDGSKLNGGADINDNVNTEIPGGNV